MIVIATHLFPVLAEAGVGVCLERGHYGSVEPPAVLVFQCLEPPIFVGDIQTVCVREKGQGVSRSANQLGSHASVHRATVTTLTQELPRG